jgi:L-rhamnose isomerase/sugar isomerase
VTVGDWGQSLLYANKLGPKAYTLVDLGHHLPNANIEQIVSLLLMEGKLAGFHFNDSKYGDDDLTVGSIKPYQLVFNF